MSNIVPYNKNPFIGVDDSRLLFRDGTEFAGNPERDAYFSHKELSNLFQKNYWDIKTAVSYIAARKMLMKQPLEGDERAENKAYWHERLDQTISFLSQFAGKKAFVRDINKQFHKYDPHSLSYNPDEKVFFQQDEDGRYVHKALHAELCKDLLKETLHYAKRNLPEVAAEIKKLEGVLGFSKSRSR